MREDGTGPDVRIPESVWRAMMGGAGSEAGNGKVDELIHAWDEALNWSRRAYRLACEMNVSYQDARFILPEGTENYIICEYNLREFLAVHDYRACSMFQWEIVHVTREMGRLLKEQSPWIVGTGAEPKISCEKTKPNTVSRGLDFGPSKVLDFAELGSTYEHMCTFQGWEQVESQCGFSWAREENRTFKPHKSI